MRFLFKTLLIIFASLLFNFPLAFAQNHAMTPTQMAKFQFKNPLRKNILAAANSCPTKDTKKFALLILIFH